MKVQIADKFLPMYEKDTRYYFLKGGRSSAKSWHVADRLLGLMVQNQDLNLICLREFQSSIKHSSKKLLADRIEFHKLNAYFEVQDQVIKCRNGRGLMIFNGLQSHTADSIKSLEGFDLVWIEESQTITSYSLELLTPTIRKDGAKLFFTYNPRRADDPVYLLEQEVPEKNKTIIYANYIDNPFCPTSIIEEAEAMKSRRLRAYNHIYLGQFGVAEGLIFENVEVRVIREDEVKGLDCVQGSDLGFKNDPTTFTQNYIDHKNKKLYVYDGFSGKGMLNSDIAKKMKDMRVHVHVTRFDSAEPRTIASLRVLGINAIGAEKGKDSVTAGINYMQEYDIVINAHLTPFITSFNNYAWDTDKLTNKPTNKPCHDFSDEVDSVRYSVSHLYKRRGKIGSIRKPTGI